MKQKIPHEIQSIRFKESEIWLLKKIQEDAEMKKRSIAGQIKYILQKHLETK